MRSSDGEDAVSVRARDRRARKRGSSLILVLATLAVFGLILGVLASILLTDLRASRRRANDRYAVELARSGVDWARAWLMEKGHVPDGHLKVEGGEIEVRVEELPDGQLRVLSTGRVREGEATLAARREVTVFAGSEGKR
jgi:type II secretory pathway component PulK